MQLGSLKDNQGVAIIITLTVIVLILTAALEMNRKASFAMEYSGVTRDRITLSHMASSGIHVAMALIIKDKKDQGRRNVDSVQDEWADPEIVAEVVADIPFDDGTLMVTISDELGSIQVNSLVNYPLGHGMNNVQYEMWERFLGYINPDADIDDITAPPSIISSIIDWIDFGDDDLITGLNGAESDYYRDLDIPYVCTNGPMAHVKELLLVKGVSELADSIGGFDAISSYLTVHGMVEEQTTKKYTFPGEININTADLAVIAAILENNVHLAEDVMAYREEVKDDGTYLNDLSNENWYEHVTGIDSEDIKTALITTHSDFFRIEAVAEINKVRLTTTAVVFRENFNNSGKYRCRVLSWETE